MHEFINTKFWGKLLISKLRESCATSTGPHFPLYFLKIIKRKTQHVQLKWKPCHILFSERCDLSSDIVGCWLWRYFQVMKSVCETQNKMNNPLSPLSPLFHPFFVYFTKKPQIFPPDNYHLPDCFYLIPVGVLLHWILMGEGGGGSELLNKRQQLRARLINTPGLFESLQLEVKPV